MCISLFFLKANDTNKTRKNVLISTNSIYIFPVGNSGTIEFKDLKILLEDHLGTVIYSIIIICQYVKILELLH